MKQNLILFAIVFVAVIAASIAIAKFGIIDSYEVVG